MKKNYNLSFLVFILFFVIFTFVALSVVPIDARKHHAKKHKTRHHKHKRSKGGNAPSGGSDDVPAPAPSPASPLPSPSLPPFPYYESNSSVFNVLSFGAKGDGVSDDSAAFLAAWRAGCNVENSKVLIPSESKFLINPITLQGPCISQLVLQVDGILLAPPSVSSWPKSSLFQWINFKWVHNFTIQGYGTFDGQGSNWWIHPVQKEARNKIPAIKPTVIRFYSSYNVSVNDIEIRSSPQCHLKFDNSDGVNVNNITISSPEDSPNTDGIHLQNTNNVEIQHSNIGCGDDCVSIQTGCSNVHIHHINCGPGHGISLGGLGKDKSVACVSNILIENITMQNTLYGARIKTWQGGLGSVKNVSFSNIQVTNVKVPIMIDQYYCDKNKCRNQTEAVAITGIRFDQIIGTYSAQPIHLACSNNVPCTNVDLIDVQLETTGLARGVRQASCWNSYGKSQGPLLPSSMDYCLRSGFVKKIAKSHENICH